MLYFLRITDSVLGPHRNCSPDNELLSPPITPQCIVSNIGKTITEGPGRTVRGWLYTWISFPSRLLHRLTLYCTVLYCTVLYCSVHWQCTQSCGRWSDSACSWWRCPVSPRPPLQSGDTKVEFISQSLLPSYNEKITLKLKAISIYHINIIHTFIWHLGTNNWNKI